MTKFKLKNLIEQGVQSKLMAFYKTTSQPNKPNKPTEPKKSVKPSKPHKPIELAKPKTKQKELTDSLFAPNISPELQDFYKQVLEKNGKEKKKRTYRLKTKKKNKEKDEPAFSHAKEFMLLKHESQTKKKVSKPSKSWVRKQNRERVAKFQHGNAIGTVNSVRAVSIPFGGMNKHY